MRLQETTATTTTTDKKRELLLLKHSRIMVLKCCSLRQFSCLKCHLFQEYHCSGQPYATVNMLIIQI